MNKVKLGQITAPVGIKGEVRVYPYVDDPARFFDIQDVFVGEGSEVFTIEKLRMDKNMVVIKFKQIPDRNSAELQRGKYLYLSKDDYDLEDDRYFIDELIGCEIITDEGKSAGKLCNVIQNTSMQDIYEIEYCEKKYLLPAVKEFILSVDVENKKIIVHLIDGMMDL